MYYVLSNLQMYTKPREAAKQNDVIRRFHRKVISKQLHIKEVIMICMDLSQTSGRFCKHLQN